jgi:hypothetical protein
MIEALIAVLVLGLVVTASLKLVALSTAGLAQVRERESLLAEAESLRIAAAHDPLKMFGTSGDVEWRVEKKTSPTFSDEGIDIASLAFDEVTALVVEELKKSNKEWRELEATRGGHTVTLFLPNLETSAASGDAGASAETEENGEEEAMP